MNRNKIYKQIMLFGLVFLILMAPLEVFSLDDTIEFSAEKEEIIGDSRVLVGYNATLLINISDIKFNCWVILQDQGEFNVVWKSIRINSTIRETDRYEENTSEVELKMDTKTQKNLTIKTPEKSLTEEDLEFDIIFTFYEVKAETEAHTIIIEKKISSSTDAFFISFIIPVLVVLGIIKRRK